MNDADMRALVLTRYGDSGATEIRHVPRPTPRAGEVLVQVHAVGLNPVDFKTRQGQLRVLFRYPLPCVLGNELAGIVVETATGVTRFKVGDRVFARVAKEHMGAFAEYAAVHETLLARVPDNLSLDSAAAVPLAGLTALQCLRDELRVGPGHTVFITGGAGGVGTFAVQLAKRLGARVVTSASPRGMSLVQSLGADQVVDYTQDRIDPAVSTADAVFDTVGGDVCERCVRAARPGTTVVTINGPVEPNTARVDLERGAGMVALFWLVSWRMRGLAQRRGVKYRYRFMRPSGDDLGELAQMLERGELRVVIDRTCDFAQIQEALSYLESGRAKGKVVVKIRDEGATSDA